MTLFLATILLLLCGAIAALITGRRSNLANLFGAGSAVTAALTALVFSLDALWHASTLTLSLPWDVPGGNFSLTVDPLSAVFLVPIFLLSLLCALYGAKYLEKAGKSRPLGPHWFFFNLLVASMALVVTAANAVLFLAAWEIMSLSSFMLVAFDHEKGDVRRAAWTYLLATHLGTAFLFALFLTAGTVCGSFDFTSFGRLATLSVPAASVCFLLALVGFGAKAGLFPLHVWLPDAHPAAPSHVSALMSGVMIKTALYGILRILTFLPPPPAWWGGILMALGILGALYGIALAGNQRDIKRCLAYSTVENVGIIVTAFGLALFASARGASEIAFFSLAGGLFHLWNHSLFKGALFLGAGSILHGTGTGDLDRMGGLSRRMPLTAVGIIGGSLAISALPPMNGFAGEWLIYLGLLQSGETLSGMEALYPLLIASMLALAGGMALIVFTRLVGIALLGEPRHEDAVHAHESAPLMTLPMTFLVFICLGIGLFPQGPLSLLGIPVTSFLQRGAVTSPLPIPEGINTIASWNGILLVFLLAAWCLVALIRNRHPAPSTVTWGCGYAIPCSRATYSAEGYTEMMQSHLLPSLLRPQSGGKGPTEIFPRREQVVLKERDPVMEGIFVPFFERIAVQFASLRWLQQGRLHIYLLYIFITSSALLLWAYFSTGGALW